MRIPDHESRIGGSRDPVRGCSARLEQPLLDLGQRGQQHVADGLQRFGRDLVQRVAGRVPGGVVEVDDVDRRDAGLQERQVVVFDRRLALDEFAAVQPLGGGPDDVGQPRASSSTRARCAGRGRRSCRRGSARGSVTACPPSAPPRRSSGCRRCGRCLCHSTTASSPSRKSSSIGIAFLRVLQHARDLDQERRARSAVVGADERELLEALGVVVAGNDQAV